MINKPLIGITLDVEGEYLRMKQQYSLAIQKAGGLPLLIPPESDAVLVAETIDALLIPGGDDIDLSYYSGNAHPSVKPASKKRTDLELSLLKAVMDLKKPVLGICYGMQLINIALSGNLYEDIGSQVKDAIDHRTGEHNITIVNASRFTLHASLSGVFNSASRIPQSSIVNSTHHQAVKELGQGLIGSAYSDDNIVEAFYMPDYPFLLGVQWHPERMNDNLSQTLFAKFVESVYAHK